jgi:aryl sulfotransferase
MAKSEPAQPRKTHEVQNVLCDSTRWDDFKFRDDDIIIATYAKTGTTWTQQIVSQLVLEGSDTDLFTTSPWVDFRLVPIDQLIAGLEAQQHRRFLKTHLPLDALVFSPKAKYIYIARDGRDTLWSLYNHHAGFTAAAYHMLNEVPGRVGPALEPPVDDIVQYFHEWLDGGGLPLGGSFWQNVQGWWNARHLPNILLLHFNELKADMTGQIRRIARFLDITINEEKWPLIVEHCTFEYMRNNGSTHSPLLDQVFQEGGKTFFHKGTNGRWKDVLSAADIEKYERISKANLTPDCAYWLATGQMTTRALRN